MGRKKHSAGLGTFLLANLFYFDGSSFVRYHSVTLFLVLRVPQMVVVGFMVSQILSNRREIVQSFMGQVFMENSLAFGDGLIQHAEGIADPGAGLPARVNGDNTVVSTGKEGAGWVDTIVDDQGSHLFLRTAFYEAREVFTEVNGVWAWRTDPNEPVIRSLVVQNASLFGQITVQTVARLVCEFPEGELRLFPTMSSKFEEHVFSNYKEMSQWTDGKPPAKPYDHSLAYTTARDLLLTALDAGPGLTTAEQDSLIEREILNCFGGDSNPSASLAWDVEGGNMAGPCLFTQGKTLGLMVNFDCNFNELPYEGEDDRRYSCIVQRNLLKLSSSSFTQDAGFIYSSDSRAFVRRRQFFGGIRVELRGSGTCSATTLHQVNYFVSTFVSYMLIAHAIFYMLARRFLKNSAYNMQYSHFDDPPTRADECLKPWYEQLKASYSSVDLTRRDADDNEGFFDKFLTSVLGDEGQSADRKTQVRAAFLSAIASRRLLDKVPSREMAPAEEVLDINIDDAHEDPAAATPQAAAPKTMNGTSTRDIEEQAVGNWQVENSVARREQVEEAEAEAEAEWNEIPKAPPKLFGRTNR